MTDATSGPRRPLRWRGPAVRVLPALAATLPLFVAIHVLPGHAAGVPLLPDLTQELPADLVVTHTGGVYRLGFRSAAGNVGAGPLIIAGSRPDRSTDELVADQVIEQRGAPKRVVRRVGRLRYVVSPDHRHWHLLGFERYELRRPGARVALVRDRKTGFCLGDRYPVAGGVPPAAPSYTSRCGLGEPARLSVTEGISVGYGDAYAANLEGQYLPLTGLRDGRYVLVHRVNTDRRLREQRYDNDAAALLLRLRWRHGVPRLTVLRACPGSATCGG
jgi:Lysyl oxidase